MRKRALALLVVGALLSGCALVDRDPLHIGGSGGTTSAPAAVGEQSAFTIVTIQNDSDDRFLLLSARLLAAGPTGGLRLAAAYAIDSLDIQGSLGAGRWPRDANYPDSVLHPVPGYPVRPHEWVHVLFVLDVLEPGRWTYDGLDVAYMSFGGLYSATVRSTWVVCADLQEKCVPLS